MSTALALMLLADGRFPAGGHAHSAGVEAAVADRRVVDDATLEAYVSSRVQSVGLAEAAMAAATVVRLTACPSSAQWRPALAELDAEAEARVMAEPLRAASRRLGRQLVRAAARCWPDSLLAEVVDLRPSGLHQPVALGAVAVVVGASAREAALLALHHAASTPAQAGVRLLGLDPFAVVALLARLASTLEALADTAVMAAVGPLAELPAGTGPLLEIAAVEHHGWDSRLFAT
jgi:urease accessory protein